MDLVICNTPFQVLQIQNMITKGIITEFECLYFCTKKTEQVDFYFRLLEALAVKATLYESDKKFPYHILAMKRIFKGKQYHYIYSASVDSVYTHSILSFTQFSKLFSFDDGAANLIETSAYYVEQRSFLKKLLFKLFGCYYDLIETKKRITSHYTIYKSTVNIIANKIEIDFEFLPQANSTSHINKKPVANVLLGTVFSELTLSRPETVRLIEQLSIFVKDKDFYYIPHPRDTVHYFDCVKYIDGLDIAESKVLTLLNEYEYVNLFGFNSSAQMNLKSNDNIKCINIYESIS